VDVLTDILTLAGIVALVGAGVIYVYLADRMVAGR
jgi:hypothetical protein